MTVDPSTIDPNTVDPNAIDPSTLETVQTYLNLHMLKLDQLEQSYQQRMQNIKSSDMDSVAQLKQMLSTEEYFNRQRTSQRIELAVTLEATVALSKMGCAPK